jgi:magnesium-transporting ATPase (P-type)
MILGSPRPGIKLTYCTDTRPVQTISEHAKNADLFICEGMYGEEGKEKKAREYKHMTFYEAAHLAKEADVNTAGSLLFIYLVTHELLFSFSCRNIKKSVLNKNIFSNKKLTLGVFLILLVQIIVLVTPISKYFIVPNIKINYILITIGICFIMFVLGELVKPIYTKLFKDYREVKNEK